MTRNKKQELGRVSDTSNETRLVHSKDGQQLIIKGCLYKRQGTIFVG